MQNQELRQKIINQVLLTLSEYDDIDFVCVSNYLLAKIDEGEPAGFVYVDNISRETVDEINEKLYNHFGLDVIVGVEITNFDYDIENIPQYSLKKMKANKVPPFDK